MVSFYFYDKKILVIFPFIFKICILSEAWITTALISKGKAKSWRILVVVYWNDVIMQIPGTLQIKKPSEVLFDLL